MADSNIPKFEDTEPIEATKASDVPSFEDTTPLETQPESLSNTLVTKLAEGGSFGLDDELAGALSGIGRAAGVSGLGGKIKDIGLAEDGPTLDMEKLLQAYRDTRDKTRGMKDQMSEESPILSPVMNLAGGLATGKMIPGKLMSPFGAAAADASLATKVATGAANAAPLGGLAGLANGKADLTRGDLAGALDDVEHGATTGAVIGGAIPLAGETLKAVGRGASALVPQKLKDLATSMIPNKIKNSYELGTQGVDKSDPEFYNKTLAEQNAMADEIADPILGQVKSNKDSQRMAIENVEGKIKTSNDINARKLAETQAKVAAEQAETQNALQSKISQVDDDLAHSKALQEAATKATSAQEIEAINKDMVKVAENIQKRVYSVKQDLGKQFDEIEAAAEKTGVVPDTQAVIQGVQDALAQNSTLLPAQIEAITKRLGAASDPGGYQAFKNVKTTLVGFFKHADPTVRSAAKQAYSTLKSSYADALEQKGFDGLAAQMKETNGRWTAMNRLEDEFLSNIRGPDTVTQKIQPHRDTIKAVGLFGKKGPEEITELNYLQDLLNKFDPKGSPGLVNQMQDVNQAMQAAKTAPANFTPTELIPGSQNNKLQQLQELLVQAKAAKPTTPDLTLPNAGTSQLEQQLAQAKAMNPNEIPGVNLNTQSPEALKDQLLSLIPKAGMQTGNAQAENKLSQAMDFITKQKGPEYAKDLQQRLGQTAKKIELRDAGNTEEIPTSVGKLTEKMLGGVSGVANKLGLRNQVKNENFLKVGADKLSSATPAQLEEVAAGISGMGKVGASYAEVLRNSATKNDISRSAMINSLMQQPAFRALFHNANGTHEEGPGDESK